MMTPDSAPAVKDKTNPSKEERCTGYVRENVSPPALFAYMGRPAMIPDSLRTPIVRTGARGGRLADAAGTADSAGCSRSGFAESGLPGRISFSKKRNTLQRVWFLYRQLSDEEGSLYNQSNQLFRSI